MIRASSVISFVILLAGVAAVQAQSTRPDSESVMAAPATVLHESIQELDREVQQRLEEAARQASRDGAGRRREAAGLRESLDELERRLDELGEPALARSLRRKLRTLGKLVANLELAASGEAPASAVPRKPRSAVPQDRVAAPVNDACADALPIALGDEKSGTTAGAGQDGAASCGSSAASPDAWYRYTASGFGRVSVDTFGSGYHDSPDPCYHPPVSRVGAGSSVSGRPDRGESPQVIRRPPPQRCPPERP
jgi:hypothetical protein